jgi:hypothetical protein
VYFTNEGQWCKVSVRFVKAWGPNELDLKVAVGLLV